MAPRLIRILDIIPKRLFRITNGLPLRVRDHPVRPPLGTIFDLVTEGGLVKPKALSPKTYQFPNGFSLRVNDVRQQQLVRRAKPASLIYTVPQGTTLPEDLILVQDTETHYSLQVKQEMTVKGDMFPAAPLREASDLLWAIDFEAKINEFFTSQGQSMTREQWIAKYPLETVLIRKGG